MVGHHLERKTMHFHSIHMTSRHLNLPVGFSSISFFRAAMNTSLAPLINLNIWDVCDWSSTDAQSIVGFPEREESGLNDDSLCTLGGARSSTPTNFQLGVNSPASSSLLLPSLSPVRRSPRSQAPKIKFDPSRVVTTGDGWQLSFVMDLQGCQPKCVSKVHDLGEYDVLIAHSAFTSKPAADRRIWLFEYFTTNCPHNEYGEKDPKICSIFYVGVMCVKLFVKLCFLSVHQRFTVYERTSLMVNVVTRICAFDRWPQSQWQLWHG